MSVSISTVARAAGVSEATVSRVINNHPGVSHATASRVRETIAGLNYNPRPSRTRPHREHAPHAAHASHGVRSRPYPVRSGNLSLTILGLATHTYQHPLTTLMVNAVSKAARHAGFHLILDEILPGEATCASFRDGKSDGIILVPNYFTNLDLDPVLQHTPIIQLLNDRRLSPNIDHVTEDNPGIGRLAQQYLQDRGCTRLLYLNHLPANQSMTTRGRYFIDAACGRQAVRQAWLCDAATTTGVPQVQHQAGVIAHSDLTTLLRNSLAELPGDSGPLGLFCANDDLAPRLYPVLADLGLHLQQDVAIVSVDNCPSRLDQLKPRPASIDLGIDDLAYHCIRLMCDRLQNPSRPPVRLQAAPRLVLPGA